MHSYFSQESHCQKGIGVPQYRSPGDGPVLHVPQPLPEPAPLDVARVPVHLVIVVQQRVSLIAVVLMYQELLA